ncbi:hypothetical protein SODALDRAFT_355171 [Sodiomyces alkalinus F11]|uniref:Uncharacterized protein n=1 Tax=Sodiomyces alkalinus (strain CBS 110278 / VKM F-3762 / F11) TaxID=1314773 RepID=A0A3N2Q890_SODAK|nr:hypothetical protein SODALDRAFT_355171 [Sodiomyces alkalinus F11]ROT42984.1 hypothetical protein SODALDRAFT_355171 [Sodiomyces alkalinus F11]
MNLCHWEFSNSTRQAAGNGGFPLHPTTPANRSYFIPQTTCLTLVFVLVISLTRLGIFRIMGQRTLHVDLRKMHGVKLDIHIVVTPSPQIRHPQSPREGTHRIKLQLPQAKITSTAALGASLSTTTKFCHPFPPLPDRSYGFAIGFQLLSCIDAKLSRQRSRPKPMNPY